jgi:hypothetical protein
MLCSLSLSFLSLSLRENFNLDDKDGNDML